MTAVLHALPVSVIPAQEAGADDPLVFHARQLRAGWPLEQTSRFSDDVWDLAPAILKKHERRFILDFTLIPASHRQVAKELCYAMLSGTVPRASSGPPFSLSAPPSPNSPASCAGQTAGPPGWAP